MKLFSLAVLVISFLFLVCSCTPGDKVAPEYGKFVGEFSPSLNTEDLTIVSIRDSDLGLKVFVDGREMGYVSVTGNFLGASPTESDQVKFLMVELTDKGFVFTYNFEKGVLKGKLLRK